MELRQLRAALAVAEHRHFGRAAAALGITQPALSQAVKGLEAELGVALFDRDTRRVANTAAGTQFLADAAAAVSLVDRAATAARAVARGDAGSLAIGSVGSAMLAPIPRVLREHRGRHPGVAVSFTALTTAEQVTRLRSGELDVGFVRPPLPDPGGRELELLIVAREPLLVVLPRGHRLAGLQRVPVRSLAGESFVRTPRALGAGLYDRITGLCRDAGFEPRVTQEAAQLQTVVALVGAGYGVSIVPGSARLPGSRSVVFADVSPAAPPVDLALAWRAGDASPVVRGFVAIARDLTAEIRRH